MKRPTPVFLSRTVAEFASVQKEARPTELLPIPLRSMVIVAVVLVLLGYSKLFGEEPSLAELEQTALSAATSTVADSVVQIRTVGGLDRVGKTLLSQGPTSGLIVSEDGYIVSSAFNFAGQPSSILVRLASGEQLAAELVARDKNLMLVLLKVATNKTLPVPSPAAHDEIRVGQWAVALGRTFQADQVGVSVGIVSALNRKYGRVIQTDANCSVANYGGPLVDISGRVLGVLVPMSPQAAGGGTENELAGAEYYDSGIGFAVPLEHLLANLQRWQQGEDLLPGKLGIGLASGDAHITAPKIVSVWPNSPADEAGWKANDLILAVNGVKVATQSHLRFQIMPLYAGDSVSVALQRGEAAIETSVILTGTLAPYRHPFLGVLPVRNPAADQPPGAGVRMVWPGSPAQEAGLAAGDRIVKLNETTIETTTAARGVLAGLHPEEELSVGVVRGDEELTLKAKLSSLPAEMLATSDLSPKSSPESSEESEDSQLEKLKLPEFSQEAVYYSPNNNRDQQLGMFLWLGSGNEEQNQSLVDAWQAICRRDDLILLIAPPQQEGTWATDDLAYLQQLARAASRRLNVDRHRMVIGGQSKAGQLAYALALKSRTTFGGVISVAAPLPRTLKLPATSPRSHLAVLTVASQDSNFAPLIRRDLQRLREAGYPTTWLQRPSTNDGTKELDSVTRASMSRWIEGLDRY